MWLKNLDVRTAAKLLPNGSRRKGPTPAVLPDKALLLDGLTESIAHFLAIGDERAADALLLRCALSQTRSAAGFIGVVEDGSLLRIVTHQGFNPNTACNQVEVDAISKATDELGAQEFVAFDILFKRIVASCKTLVFCNAPSPEFPFRSFLGVPVYSRNQPVGVLGVANRAGVYTLEQQAALTTLAQAAGVLNEARRRQEKDAALEAASQETQRELQEKEERFRLLVEGVKDCAIVMLDPQGRVASWNAGVEKLHGYHEDEVTGQHFSLFYPRAEIAGGKPERVLQIAAAQGHCEDEGWRVRRDRTQFWAHVVVTALRDGNGNLRGFANVTRDITERKYSEKVLRESEERRRFIIEAAPAACISIDAHGIILDWNRQAEKIFGWARTHAIGRSVARTILPLRYRKLFLRGLERYRASGRGLPLDRPLELTALRQDGHPFPIEASLSCLHLENGYVFSAFLRDITKRKQGEEKVRRIPGEILQAQEAERKRVARELHDSVSQILSSAKLTLQSIERSSSQVHPDVRPEVLRAKILLGRCMEEVRRIARNLMPSELEDLGLMPAVRTLCAEFRQQKTIKLKLKYFRIPKDLPNEIKLVLFRVIQEALNNIIKHAEATRAMIEVVRRRSTLEVSITDNGKGFDPCADPARSQKRSGMGMLNMRQRVDSIGGSFQLRSAAGRGTAIKVAIRISGDPIERKASP